MWRHISSYIALIWWLLRKAFRWFGWRISLGVALSLAAVAFEMLAFYLVFQALHAFELTGPPNPTDVAAKVEWFARLPPAMRVVLPASALLIAAVLTYLGRSISIRVQGLVAQKLSQEIMVRLAGNLSFYDRLSLPFGLDKSEVLRAVINDTASCGTAVRLTMLHVASVIYMLVGIAILAVLSPALLGLWLIALLLIVPSVYLINLRALREARDLLKVAPQYRRALTGQVRSLIDVDQPAAAMSTALQDRYFSILGHRLRIVEISRLALGVVFSLTMATFLLIAQRPEFRTLINVGGLLLLFLAFRYTYQGFQGISVLVTTINRNLPSLIRVNDVARRLDLIINRSRHTRPPVNVQGEHAKDIPWAVDLEGNRQNGRFEAGKSYAFLIPGPTNIGGIRHAFAIVSGRAGKEVFMSLAGSEPPLVNSKVPVELIGSQDSFDEAWICDLLKAELPDLARDQIEAMLKASQTVGADVHPLIRLATVLKSLSMVPRRIVVIDGNELSTFRLRTQRKLLALLSKHIVLSLTNRLAFHLVDHAYDQLLVCSGTAVRLVLPMSNLTTEAMRNRARTVFGSEREQVRQADRGSDALEDDAEFLG